jgi:SAM-dependent methyltransferase
MPTVNGLRPDLRLIADLVEPNTRVLDVGCSDGALLAFLARTKGVDARGIELSQAGVHECVSRGLAVVQGDADTDLAENMLRIGRFGIVSFTNYAHWRARWHLMLRGRMPMARCLPEPWYATSNIHPCTLEDFERLCGDLGVEIRTRISLAGSGAPSRLARRKALSNLLSEQALFLLSRPASRSAT